jgi:hypothetical protein
MPAIPAYLREGVSEVDYKAHMDRVKPFLDSLLSTQLALATCMCPALMPCIAWIVLPRIDDQHGHVRCDMFHCLYRTGA